MIHPLDSVTSTTTEKSKELSIDLKEHIIDFEQVRKVTWSNYKAVTGPKINCTNNCL